MIGNLLKNIGRCGSIIVNGRVIGKDNVSKMLLNVNMSFFSSQSSISATTNIAQGQQSQQQSTSTGTVYAQRAFTPSEMSSQLINQLSNIKQATSQQIIHQLSLYYNKLLPFDYDYFTESLRRLIYYQQKLSMDEILMLFQLAVEYKIDSLILEKQFMNQLYCRVEVGMRRELLEYDLKVEEQLRVTYNMLQGMSKDHFQIINEYLEGEKEQSGTKQQQQLQKQQKQHKNTNTSQKQTTKQPKQLKYKPIHNNVVRKSKSKKISPQVLNRITKIFINSNSKHVQFNKLLLQVHTIRMDQTNNNKQLSAKVQGQDKQAHKKQQQNNLPSTPQNLLIYTRLTINLLQLYMTEYQSTLSPTKNSKQNKYTHRSVKNIYKLQNFYYYQVAKMIQQKLLLAKATNQQLLQFVNVLSAFPIKRRSFRKAVGEVVIGEFIKREIGVNAELMRFFQLSRHDNKLLMHFQNKINQNNEKLPQIEQKLEKQKLLSQKEGQLLTFENNTQGQSQLNNQQQQSSLFKMPLSLFKKVTKKKSKPKNKKNSQNQVQIDLTQPQEQISTQSTKTQSHPDKQQQQQKQQNSQ